ncbi:MAG: hypothetical protein ABIR11_06885 [Candidatus Limnocylindrales bacterium]
MHRILPAILFLVLAAGMAGTVQANSGVDVVVQADLDGQPIMVSEVPGYFCQDRDFPAIHCFRTARALEGSIAARASGPSIMAAASSDYVIVYAGLSYSGTYMYVSQNYDTLFTVAWNDRIRSYRGLNGASGVFWTDWYATGDDLTFCCNVLDPSLPATFDKAITSVYRR